MGGGNHVYRAFLRDPLCALTSRLFHITLSITLFFQPSFLFFSLLFSSLLLLHPYFSPHVNLIFNSSPLYRVVQFVRTSPHLIVLLVSNLLVYLCLFLTIGVFLAILVTTSTKGLPVGKINNMSPSKHVYQGMSPHPSGVNVEYVDTIPGTHLTAFSSDRRSGSSGHEAPLGFTSPDHSATVHHLGSKYEDKDPFTSPGAKVRPEQKLSATASAFQPFNIRLNQGSMHSTNNVRGNVSDTTISAKLKNEDSHLMDPNSPSGSLDSGIVKLGTFSTDTRVTRAIRIFGIYMPVSREQVETCLQVSFISFQASFIRVLQVSENPFC